MKIIARMFSRHWLVATLLVIAAMGVLVRLGIWQLDRMHQRQAFNARASAQLAQPELLLDGKNVPQGLEGMEYRSVRVRGTYDFSQQIALRNQYWGNNWGVNLVTPLHILGSDQVVLVDRGWIPAADYESGDWSKYDEPGVVEVEGMLRASQDKAQLGSKRDPALQPGETGLKAWYFVNIPRIMQQVPYPLLAAYVQQGPTPGESAKLSRSLPELDLSEGPHLSYAIQWFSFALILAIGYPFYIRRQEERTRRQEDHSRKQANSQQALEQSVNQASALISPSITTPGKE